MSRRTLPAKPNVEHLKKIAKSLLRALADGDTDVQERLQNAVGTRSTPGLQDIQLMLAREHGFRNWAMLKAQAERINSENALLSWYAMLHPLYQGSHERSVKELLAKQAQLLLMAWNEREPAAENLFRIDVARRQGRPEDEVDLAVLNVTEADAQRVIACEHGYSCWEDVPDDANNEAVDLSFERAANAIVEGDVDGLKESLAAAPQLATQRSAFPHRATLLHYVSANGVESYRQWQSPSTAPLIADALLKAGANPDATSELYGGGPNSTALCMLVSSAHPAAADVQDDLVYILCANGANPNGVADDGAPLWTAIAWGYRLAAEALFDAGARVDNVLFAAALGNLEQVKQHVTGTLSQHPTPWSWLNGPHDRERILGLALLYATGCGRTDIVRYLLDQDVGLHTTDPIFGGTAVGWARHLEREDCLQLLTEAAS